MNVRIKWIACALFAAGALSAALVRAGRTTRFERDLFKAENIEFTGWSSYWDGGSRSFEFELPGSNSLVVFVPHRNPGFDGNPDFQEIWLGSDAATKRQFLLNPGSALEARLLTLMQTATVRTNAGMASSNWPWAPSPAVLKWLATRIHDRKSKW